jgi:hypothetical protein
LRGYECLKQEAADLGQPEGGQEDRGSDQSPNTGNMDVRQYLVDLVRGEDEDSVPLWDHARGGTR